MSPRRLNIISYFLLVIGAYLVYSGVISFWVLLGFFLLYFIFLITVSTNVRLNFFVRSYNSRPQVNERIVALSFDDGPVENTLKILELLDKYNAKAGFFCIGKNIEKNPEIFREIIKRGHMVGNHTYSHTRKMGFLSSEIIRKEIEKCDAVSEKVAGVRLRLFRPPFGIINPKTQKALKMTGHKVIGWNVRSYDAILNSEEYVLKRITRNLKAGDVILLHDNNPQTVSILEQLLIFLEKNQFKAVRPDNLFEINAYSS